MLEHVKVDSSPSCCLRRRLGASGCIYIAYYICFAFLPSLVLNYASRRTLNFNALWKRW